jgi:hypothetical protein
MQRTLRDVLQKGTSKEEFQKRLIARMAKRKERGFFAFERTSKYLVERQPGYTKWIIDEADVAMCGEVVLPGTGGKPMFVGNPPDWLTNPTGDSEFLVQLNRMTHWPVLLQAHGITGDGRYAAKVVGELEDWLAKCPAPEIGKDPEVVRRDFSALTPWRLLEVGIRMFETWPPVLCHLAGSSFMSQALLERMILSMDEHAELLLEMSPILWPDADHNHALMENLGLLSVATMLPELDKSAARREHAIRELERCAANQLTKEGGQIEGCPGYHNGCVYWFCLAIRLADEAEAHFSQEYWDRVRGSMEYTLHTMRPTGEVVPWGDSRPDHAAARAAISWRESSGESEYLKEVTRLIGAAAVKDFVMEKPWSVNDVEGMFEEIAAANKGARKKRKGGVYWAKELKQVAMRTDWGKEALSVFFACRTPVNNGHAHIDPMSFDFTAMGRAMVVDPSYFTYATVADRKLFKSAAWHSTLTINDQDPFEYRGPWSYSPQKEGRIIDVWERPGLMAVAAEHLNYEPAVHQRLVALVEEQFLVVVDEVKDVAEDAAVQIYYHLDSTKARTWKKDGIFAAADFGDVGLMIAVTGGMLSAALLPGRVSTHTDVAHASLRLKITDIARCARRLYATVLLPYRMEKEVDAPCVSISGDGGRIICRVGIEKRELQLTWSDGGVELAGL